MIFVTVGTHEQQFNRLIREIDEIKKNNAIEDTVIIQTGFSDYEPQYCESQKVFSYKDMDKLIDEARIVITHGGPSSFIAPLQKGKIPIVVPRQKQYEEHVNNHQLNFVDSVSQKYNNIIVVKNIKELKKMILNYDDNIKSMKSDMISNNKKFNQEFEKIVEDLFKGQEN